MVTKRKPSAVNTRIMIVDDHPIVRRGLVDVIEQESDLRVCAEAATASEAFRELKNGGCELAIIDLSLKETDGLELVKQIKARYPSVRMLVASVHSEEIYAERVIRAGAMGYINKAQATEKVVQAVRQVLKGSVYLSSAMSEQLLHRMMQGSQEAQRSPMENLSDRELEVFELIGRGHTTQQISQALHLSPKTIETYREHIKTKLNLGNSTELVRHAVQWGTKQS